MKAPTSVPMNPVARVSLGIMDLLLHDLRLAARRLARSPGFAAVTVFTLALGIGASTTVFSIANWIALRPVPGLADQARLVTVEFLGTRRGQPISYAVSKMDVDDLRAGVPALDLAGYAPFEMGVAIDDAPARTVHGHYVTEHYFPVLGVRLTQGAGFTPEQVRVSAPAPMAVISHALWRSLLGGAPRVLGRVLTVNGLRVEIVGVAAPGFRGPRLLGDVDLWLPGPAYYPLGRGIPPGGEPVNQRLGKQFGFMVGRLRPGATIAEATTELSQVGDRLAEAYPREDGFFRGLGVKVQTGIGVPPRQRDAVERMIAVLAGIGAVMILIAIANATNLLLCRAVTNQGALTLERALGASPWRIIRQRSTESLILSVLSGMLGATLTIWLAGFFQGRLVPSFETFTTRVHVDWRVFGFAVLLATIVGLLLGAIPGLVEPPADLASALKSRLVPRGSSAARQLRQFLTMGQVALSVALLVGALLLAGTLRKLRNLEIGLDPREVTTIWTNLPAGGFSGERAHALVSQLRERILDIPGVDRVAFANSGPFFEMGGGNLLRAPGQPPDTVTIYPATRVTPEYFHTLGIPLLRGRDFFEAEMGVIGTGRPIVLSESAARRFFGTEDPLDRTLVWGSPRFESPARVIGVVGDVNWTTLGQYGSSWAQQVYTPMGEAGQWASLFVIVHSPGGVATPASIREVLGDVAPSLPAFRTGTAADQIEYNLTERRLLSNAAVLSSVLAVLLASLGLYAVVSFAVAQRHREMGIRMALGAQARQILRMVFREAGTIGAAGVVAGLMIAGLLSRLIRSRLYGLDHLEPMVYVLAAVAMFVLVIVACLVPARAATRVDPVVALRSE